jgi:cytochrome c553
VLLLLAVLAGATGCGRKQDDAPGGSVPVPPVTAGAGSVQAQVPSPELIMAGGTIASAGVPTGGVPPCTACHGSQGEGMPASGFPRLAGQAAPYLLGQLTAYAKGTRKNPVMAPIASKLSDDQRASVAAYYA